MDARLLTLLCAFSVACGCASMRSTMLNRREDDALVKNGMPTPGVPVTVRVPTHLDIFVLETMYYYDPKVEDKSKKDAYTFCKVEFPGAARNLKLRSEIVRTEKVMTVDFKRPAAGIGDFNLKFTTGTNEDKKYQYITQFETYVFDRTMEDTANLVASIVPGVSAQSSKADPTATSFILGASKSAAGGTIPTTTGEIEFGSGVKNYLVKDSVVAYQRFDLNACDFEEQVRAFLEHHLNGCHDCCHGEAKRCDPAAQLPEEVPASAHP
jgi:hypothetical protein